MGHDKILHNNKQYYNKTEINTKVKAAIKKQHKKLCFKEDDDYMYNTKPTLTFPQALQICPFFCILQQTSTYNSEQYSEGAILTLA